MKNKRKAINHIAEVITDVLNLSPPVDIETIPEILGGKLEYIEFEDPKLEARIRRDGESFIIELDSERHSNERKRFSIAHELGHLFLHMGFIFDEEKWNNKEDYSDSVYYRFGHSEEEYEANEFAAALLMPKEDFQKACIDNLENGTEYNLVNIAEIFEVSEEAALTRGRWLGIFAW